MLLICLLAPTWAASAKWDFAAVYDNVEGGAWYRDATNEDATLAWGEAYVMMGIAAMVRATGDPAWLDRLAWHADGVLAQRDDARGVADYRGVSGACWQNTSYQDGAYCYVVHSGMIAWPMAEFARLVGAYGWDDELAYDGARFGDKAAAYLQAAREVAASHDDQWDAAGYYTFRADADFLSYPGADLPLNQSNAMGRLLITLWQLTGEDAYREKAEALAARFADQLTAAPSGAWLWNYWGGTYEAPGEDISHAAISVDFAVMAAGAGLVFDEADLQGFAETFMGVYQDDETFTDSVGGGGVNGSSYLPQIGRWLRLSPTRWSVYAAVADLYEGLYEPEDVASGSLVATYGYLAEYEPPLCEHFFYYVDWEDLGDWREATAYGANVLTRPPDFSQPCLVPLRVILPLAGGAQQWDGALYHDSAKWAASEAEKSRRVAYDPRWPHEYYDGGVLFQFDSPHVAGDGLRVMEPEPLTAPVITTAPEELGQPGVAWSYAPAGEGDAPFYWRLVEFPTGARADAATGELSWTPPAPGSYGFTLALENDAGAAEQSWVVEVAGEDTGEPGATDGGGSDGGTTDGGTDGTVDSASVDSAAPADTGWEDGFATGNTCSCGSKGAAGWLLLPLLLGWRRRR